MSESGWTNILWTPKMATNTNFQSKYAENISTSGKTASYLDLNVYSWVCWEKLDCLVVFEISLCCHSLLLRQAPAPTVVVCFVCMCKYSKNNPLDKWRGSIDEGVNPQWSDSVICAVYMNCRSTELDSSLSLPQLQRKEKLLLFLRSFNFCSMEYEQEPQHWFAVEPEFTSFLKVCFEKHFTEYRISKATGQGKGDLLLVLFWCRCKSTHLNTGSWCFNICYFVAERCMS